MKKSTIKNFVALIIAMIMVSIVSVNTSFAATQNKQKPVKVFENDKFIVYEQESSLGDLDLDITFEQAGGSVQTRAIPNHVGSKISKIDNNRVKVVSRNYGVDTVDRVQISVMMTNKYGYSTRAYKNEYNIAPFFSRTNTFYCSNWQTMSFNIEVWDGGQYGSKFGTIVNR